MKEELFAIELHGGASLVNDVKSVITGIFGHASTQSLNPDECFAIGGGFQAAILSPQYHVNLTVKDVCPHRVQIEYKDFDGVPQQKELFSQFNSFPSTKRIPLKAAGNFSVRCFTDEYDLGTVIINTGRSRSKKRRSPRRRNRTRRRQRSRRPTMQSPKKRKLRKRSRRQRS
jgi:molecular chaperone DnaK (HSP70)